MRDTQRRGALWAPDWTRLQQRARQEQDSQAASKKYVPGCWMKDWQRQKGGHSAWEEVSGGLQGADEKGWMWGHKGTSVSSFVTDIINYAYKVTKLLQELNEIMHVRHKSHHYLSLESYIYQKYLLSWGLGLIEVPSCCGCQERKCKVEGCSWILSSYAGGQEFHEDQWERAGGIEGMR